MDHSHGDYHPFNIAPVTQIALALNLGPGNAKASNDNQTTQF